VGGRKAWAKTALRLGPNLTKGGFIAGRKTERGEGLSQPFVLPSEDSFGAVEACAVFELRLLESALGLGSGEPPVLQLVGPYAFGDDLEDIVRQAALQFERHVCRRGEDHQHSLRTDQPNDAVRLRVRNE
jgi:hypothetical protein